MSKIRTLSFLATFWACLVPAQAQVASRISGTVRDASQAAIPGVSVTVREENRGTTATTLTNEVGRYSFTNLTVGEYVVTAEMAGFKRAATPKIKLNVNQSVEVDVTMEITFEDGRKSTLNSTIALHGNAAPEPARKAA